MLIRDAAKKAGLVLSARADLAESLKLLDDALLLLSERVDIIRTRRIAGPALVGDVDAAGAEAAHRIVRALAHLLEMLGPDTLRNREGLSELVGQLVQCAGSIRIGGTP